MGLVVTQSNQKVQETREGGGSKAESNLVQGEGGKPWREERLGAGQGSQCRVEGREEGCLEVRNQAGAQEHALTDAVG